MVKSLLSLLYDWMIVPGIVVILVGVALAHGWEHWYVEPARDGKWRVCETSFKWSGGGTSCSSLLSHDEAQWWSETKGGILIK